MNEFNDTIKIINGTIKTVKLIDAAKKLVIAGAALSCGVLAVRFFKNQRVDDRWIKILKK